MSYRSPVKTLHKNAVGIYIGARHRKNSCTATLECCGKRFSITPEVLVPYEGEINEEHLKLITPIKKVHLLEYDRCACKCDSNPNIYPPKLCIDEFLTVPENKRCANCNKLAKKIRRA